VADSHQPLSSSKLRHVLTMVVLCVSGGAIYNVVYVFEVYYIPTQQAMDLTKSQMGLLLGVFGAVSLACYGPGGWLADRFSSRKLITLAMLVTGGTGFYYATFPSYPVALALHAFWGVTIALVFWNALIRATRNWASSASQGRAFGFLEAGRGLFGTLGSSVLLGVFTWMGSTRMALSTVISSWSAVIFVCGVAAWFVLEDDAPSNRIETDHRGHKVGWKEVVQVLRMPAVWLIAIVINATNSGFWATYYFTPYASEVFLLSVAAAGLISVGRNWLNPIAPFVSGFVADRFGISRTSAVLLFLMTLSFALFTVTPARTSLLPLVLLNGAVAALAIYALRGIYFALLDEQGVPAAVTGMAAGTASLIGFTSDVYMPVMSGAILDNYPGLSGYRVLFGVVTLIAALGTVAAWLLVRNRQTLTSR
jgi:nitrate/nitrite transporter NarK